MQDVCFLSFPNSGPDKSFFPLMESYPARSRKSFSTEYAYFVCNVLSSELSANSMVSRFIQLPSIFIFVPLFFIIFD